MLASTRMEYPKISMETVISLAPDVIIDVGEMGESPESSERRGAITEALWRRETLVKAVRDGHVHAVQRSGVRGPRAADRGRRRSDGCAGFTTYVHERRGADCERAPSRLARGTGTGCRARELRREARRVRGADGAEWRRQEHGRSTSLPGCARRRRVRSTFPVVPSMSGPRSNAPALSRTFRRVCARTSR